MVLCVGPTGSGKTTTLHSALHHLNQPDRKVWTAEDPVEITQHGLRQIQVNPKIGWTFATALRSLLRADPDVIMVGEIRDQETAEIAVEASLTGHLVMSTLHTNTAAETITRLIDLGVDPFSFADSILAVMAQRLVRRLCVHCVRVEPMSDGELEQLTTDFQAALGPNDPMRDTQALHAHWRQTYGEGGQLRTWHAVGCEKCAKTGFRGRLGIHELLTVNAEMRHLIQVRARPEDLLKQALADGMRTLRQDGIEKVLLGHTGLSEIRANSNG
jgi:type II secretory ATPase GspE/PulE/Tfp pilus assembly ATPase PilB-like protein